MNKFSFYITQAKHLEILVKNRVRQSLANLVPRDSRPPRTEKKGSECEIAVCAQAFTLFFGSQKRRVHVLTFHKTLIESSFTALDCVIGSDFIWSDRTSFVWTIHVQYGSGQPFSKSIFGHWTFVCFTRMSVEYYICGVVRRNFDPNSPSYRGV